MTNTPNPSANASDDAALRALARNISERSDRPLVLVGMMGVGKSTIGRRLAQALDFSFTDADDEIVAAAQMSIPEMFERYDEAYFRDGERRVIERLLNQPKCVLATGGGAFVQDDTRALIMEKGLAIWLDADLETLIERVKRNNNRPLLRGGDTREIVARMKQDREAAYAQAPIHVISKTGPHGDTVARILRAIDQWL